jgi:hypothetical protein
VRPLFCRRVNLMRGSVGEPEKIDTTQ